MDEKVVVACHEVEVAAETLRFFKDGAGVGEIAPVSAIKAGGEGGREVTHAVRQIGIGYQFLGDAVVEGIDTIAKDDFGLFPIGLHHRVNPMAGRREAVCFQEKEMVVVRRLDSEGEGELFTAQVAGVAGNVGVIEVPMLGGKVVQEGFRILVAVVIDDNDLESWVILVG